MKVITIGNEKGGVGKTTTAITLAVGLTALGYNVLLMDTDPQGHCSEGLGIFGEDGKPMDNLAVYLNMRLVMRRKYPITELLVEVPLVGLEEYGEKGKLLLFPSSIQTAMAGIQVEMSGLISPEHKIASSRLGEVLLPELEALGIDYVIIDTSPTVSLLTPLLLAMSDYVLIPSVPEALSVHGVARIISNMALLASIHDAEVLGIVPTMVQPNTGEHKAQLDMLVAAYKDLVWADCAIGKSIRWAEAQEAKVSILQYTPDHPSAAQGWNLVERVLEVVNG